MQITKLSTHDSLEFIYYKISYSMHELLPTIERAKDILHVLNSKNPAGLYRTTDEKYMKNLGGLIAEKMVNDLLDMNMVTSP